MPTDQQIAVAARALRVARTRLRSTEDRLAAARVAAEAALKDLMIELDTRTKEHAAAAAALDALATGP